MKLKQGVAYKALLAACIATMIAGIYRDNSYQFMAGGLLMQMVFE